MFNSVAEVQKFIKEYDVKMVDFKMVDLEGRWRHLSIPVERFTEDTMVEGIHPNDLGMRQYADAYIKKLREIFPQEKHQKSFAK